MRGRIWDKEEGRNPREPSKSYVLEVKACSTVLTADSHATQGRIRGRVSAIGKGGGPRSAAHSEIFLTRFSTAT